MNKNHLKRKKKSAADKFPADENLRKKVRRAVKNVAVPEELEAKVLNLIRESG